MATETSVGSHPHPWSQMRSLAAHPVVLWIAFLLVHVVVGWLALIAPGARLGDVTTVYLPWAEDAVAGMVMGISEPWVYPAPAIVPILVPLLVGASHYIVCWLVMVLVVDAAGFAWLTAGGDTRAIGAAGMRVARMRGQGTRVAAAWWWLTLILLLGPVALSRLDTLTVPLAIIGLLLLGGHTKAAAVLVSVATWIKVWPAALVLAMLVAVRRRGRILLTGLTVSAVVVALALAAGAGVNVFSFVTAQADRGLQIEAPVSGIWMWQALFHHGGSIVFYDPGLNTFEVTGPGINTAIALMTPLLVVVCALIALVGMRAVRAGVGARRILPALALALVAALIVFNKVGSPQYLLWLAPPMVIGLVWQGRRFLVPAVLVGIAAGLTQVFYPVLYLSLLRLNPVLLTVLTLRNATLIVVLCWAVVALWRSVGSSVDVETG